VDLHHKARHIKMTASGTPGRAHPPKPKPKPRPNRKAATRNRKINGAQMPLTQCLALWRRSDVAIRSRDRSWAHGDGSP
jgi:hypothetical protein